MFNLVRTRGANLGRLGLIAGVAILFLAAGFWLFPRDEAGAVGDVAYVAPVPDAPDVTVHVVIPIPNAPPALAHYVEHLAWLGAFGGQDRSVDRHSNAWAMPGAVGYWLSGQPRDLPEIFQSLNRLFEPLDVPDAFAEEEKNILLREYDMRVRSRPMSRAHEMMDAYLYDGNQAAVSISGTPEQIRALQYSDAKTFHGRTHRRETARFVVTGNVRPRDVQRALEPLNWPAAEAVSPMSLTLMGQGREQFVVEDSVPQYVWRRVVELPEPTDFDVLQTEVDFLRDALDTTLPGGLAGPLRFQSAITSRYSLRISALDEQHIEMQFIAKPDTGVSLMQVQTAYEEVLAQIAADGLPRETFDRVLLRFEDYWPDWDDARDVARWRAGEFLRRVEGMRVPLDIAGLRGLHDRISLERINMLLRSLAGSGRTAVTFIGPEGELP